MQQNRLKYDRTTEFTDRAERQREREGKEGGRERERERQTDRQTDRQRGRRERGGERCGALNSDISYFLWSSGSLNVILLPQNLGSKFTPSFFTRWSLGAVPDLSPSLVGRDLKSNSGNSGNLQAKTACICESCWEIGAQTLHLLKFYHCQVH